MACIVSKSGPISASSLQQGLVRCASQLETLGVTPESTVLVQTVDPLLALTITFACGGLGATAGLLTASALSYAQATGHTVIISDKAVAPLHGVNAITVRELQSVQPSKTPITEILERLKALTPPSVLFTFLGVTGTPKLIRVSSDEVVSRAHPSAQQPALPAFITLHGVMSIAWVSQVFRELRRGSTLLLKYDPNTWSMYSLGRVYASPSQVLALCDRFGSSIKQKIAVANVIGGPLSTEGFAKILKVFERVEYCYGVSETGQVTSKVISQVSDANGGVGRVDHSDTRTIRIAAGAKPGEPGPIRISTGDMCKSYIGDSALTQIHFDAEMFIPGDLGYLDASGELFITGRLDDLINIGGEKFTATQVCTQIEAVFKGTRAAAFPIESTSGHTALGIALEGAAEEASVVSSRLSQALWHHRFFRKAQAHLYFVSQLEVNAAGRPNHKQIAQSLKDTKPDARFVIEISY